MEVQKFDLSLSEYKHKKFSKRKRNTSESTQSCSGSSTISTDMSLEDINLNMNPSASNSSSSSPSEELENPPAKIRKIDPKESSSKQEEDDSIASQLLVPQEKFLELCKFHPNMVRKFPPKARSKEEQERRDKNTIACRISRRAKKLEEMTMQEQYNERRQTYEKVLIESIRAGLYVNELMKLLKTHVPVNN